MGARCRSCAAAAMSGLRRWPARCVKSVEIQQRLKTSLKLPKTSKMACFERPFTADGKLTYQMRDLHVAMRPISRPRPEFPEIRPKSAQELGPRPGVCPATKIQ